MNLLDKVVAQIKPLDKEAAAAARARQGRLTKPPGSLGYLEEVSIRIAGITGQARPTLKPGAIFVMAGDHGICAQGVSAYPPEVTPQMVANILSGGAAINVLARAAGARVVVADIGVAQDISSFKGLYNKKIAYGTANISAGPAMTIEEARRAVEAGIEVFQAEFAREPFGIAATGDMGIGNTSPSTAIAAVLLHLSPRDIVGRGTGLDDEGLARKGRAIEHAIEVNRPNPQDALDILAKVGGFELGAIAGIILAAAAQRIPVIIDGYISGAAAMTAKALAPLSADYMIAGHISADSGHAKMLTSLGLRPLIDLDMRLGEGTGAALAMHLCRAACLILDEMATFDEAGVTGEKE